MGRMIDLTGQRFGRLTVVEFAGKDNRLSRLWKCKCDCGNECVVLGVSLKSRNTVSCGCVQKEWASHNSPFLNKNIQTKALRTAIKKNQKDGTMLGTLQSKISKANKSGVKGVFWDNSRQKWLAIIGFKNKQIHLGRYDTLEAATKARAVAEEQYFQPILDKYKDTSNNSESSDFKPDLMEAVK